MTVAIGLGISPAVVRDADPVASAVAAEELGFDFVSTNDHIHGSGPRHEAWTLLSWIAASTSRIRVLTRVLGVPYRNPAVLAAMAETFDRLSGGRLILGLGAGASEVEFAALGLGTAAAPARLEGLEEAIDIIRGIWSQASYSHNGRHYRTDAAQIEPKPMHPIPIWLGTRGPRGLELTGRLADGWIPSIDLAPPDAVPAMLERIDAAAQRAGRNPDAIIRAYNLEISLDSSAEHGPHVVSGTPDVVADRLASFVAIGMTALNLIVVGERPKEQIERLARDVLPAVRAAVGTEPTPRG
jgi:probable F420-dependent oxidoreductase